MSIIIGRLLDNKLPELKDIGDFVENNPDALLGYVMELGYEEGKIITNDYNKMKNGGLSKNSFLLITLKDRKIYKDVVIPEHYILARVKEPTPTPLAYDVSQTYFELHKSNMPQIDAFTLAELQWSAVKITILGTYYGNKNGKLIFGNDIETYFSPYHYKVYKPSNEILYKLINNSIKSDKSFVIGKLRYTETMLYDDLNVNVKVSAKDFLAARTALFAMTRAGKSNTVKIIAESIIQNYKNVGQIIFDINGEYANVNEQDNTSLYEKYKERCEKYSVIPRGLETKSFRVNVYKDVKLGHEIIRNLLELDGTKSDYFNGFLSFEILDNEDLEILKEEDRGKYERYRRHLSVYLCVLYKSGFTPPRNFNVSFNIKSEILKEVFGKSYPTAKRVPLKDAADYYERIWEKYCEIGDKSPFKSNDKKYFDETDISLLSILCGKKQNNTAVSGKQKLMKYTEYHDVNAENAINDILGYLKKGKTVILDLSNSNPLIVKFFSEKICKSIFNMQMEAFTSNSLKDKYIQFYFEEAHNLFPSNDNDLTNIYNRLAKEGSKLNIGVVYATQSITSLSRDLLKTTENFFIGHLNEQSEINELTKFYKFKDVALDIQKNEEKGFLRIVTKSHRYALPVQIKIFGRD